MHHPPPYDELIIPTFLPIKIPMGIQPPAYHSVPPRLSLPPSLYLSLICTSHVSGCPGASRLLVMALLIHGGRTGR